MGGDFQPGPHTLVFRLEPTSDVQSQVTLSRIELGFAPHGSDTDCNGDGVPDAVEIANGAADCDHNGVPDSCQPDEDADGYIDSCDQCLGTVAGAPVDGFGCPPVIRFDFNRDGDIDEADFVQFMTCMTGPIGEALPTGCTDEQFAVSDLDGDQNVDQEDFGRFQRCLSSSGKLADANCVN